jgi:hypothetical protein
MDEVAEGEGMAMEAEDMDMAGDNTRKQYYSFKLTSIFQCRINFDIICT